MSDDRLEPDHVRGGIGRSATTIELFFDLVYVFAITQVAGLIHSDMTPAGLGKGALVLYVLWWTWSIYAWTTNWTGTRPTSIKLVLLAAMAMTLVMAAAVPRAFGDGSTIFAATLFAVRVLVAILYWRASADYPLQRAAFFTFFPLSFVAALLYLAGGLGGPDAFLLCLCGGAALDLVSALMAGRGTWAVDPTHFAERNGLFVIIALGESVVGLGFASASVELAPIHVAALIISFTGVASLWWEYFDRTARLAEDHFTTLRGKEQGRFARDAYTLLHYPLVVGIVFFPVALEEAVIYPDEALSTVARSACAGGAALVIAGLVGIVYRTKRKIGPERSAVVLALIAMIWLGAGLSALLYAAVVSLLLVLNLLIEHERRFGARAD
jgi:low temperature requirement protein LtrA